MQFNIEQLNIGKADNSTFNIQNSTLNIAVGLVFNVKLLGCETIHN